MTKSLDCRNRHQVCKQSFETRYFIQVYATHSMRFIGQYNDTSVRDTNTYADDLVSKS